ncbi:hypothetical protein AAFF_G00161990 [Aldrovandia affinis]|uniref:Uncharacterized protein n=1 Tax=Aldrovandia affinis TaxID=143900 RepID=A0AAD7RN59_9TELE|nr:hypothetical protein AAFF_G00161990 [Aldrovandia affinis]
MCWFRQQGRMCEVCEQLRVLPRGWAQRTGGSVLYVGRVIHHLAPSPLHWGGAASLGSSILDTVNPSGTTGAGICPSVSMVTCHPLQSRGPLILSHPVLQLCPPRLSSLDTRGAEGELGRGEGERSHRPAPAPPPPPPTP